MSDKVVPQKMITREMTIDDILSAFPHYSQQVAQELTNSGLHCVGCHAATWETLEAGARGHGMGEETIDTLVKRLNAIIEKKIDVTNVTMTPRAAQKFLQFLKEENRAGWALRFGEMKSGCSGFQYVLDYSEKPEPDDEVFESNGVEIHVKKESLPRLLGSEIDYVDGLQGAGFKISNPNTAKSCGCGHSHGYKK